MCFWPRFGVRAAERGQAIKPTRVMLASGVIRHIYRSPSNARREVAGGGASGGLDNGSIGQGYR